MGAVHIIPGADDPTCGIAVAARQLVSRGVGGDGEVWVHSMWLPSVLWSSFVALCTGRKLVRMPHGCTDPAKLRHHWWKKCLIAPFERYLFRCANCVVATCDEEAEWIKLFEPKAKRIEVVRLSTPGPYTKEVGIPSLERRIGRTSLSLRLLYVGRLHKLKGVSYLLDAIAQCPNCRSIELRLIGKDDGEGKLLRTKAAHLNIDAKFEGIVLEDEKFAAFDWCDVLVLPTLSDNFGLVVAEALERGKRVITTDGAPAWGDGNDYGGRLAYLKGYRDGTAEERVGLLKTAIGKILERMNNV